MEDDTSWLPAELAPVALRLARADEAVYQLSELTLNWSRGAEDRGTLDLVEVLTDAGELDLVVAGIRPIPPLVAMLFSEAVHHLRAAIETRSFTWSSHRGARKSRTSRPWPYKCQFTRTNNLSKTGRPRR